MIAERCPDCGGDLAAWSLECGNAGHRVAPDVHAEWAAEQMRSRFQPAAEVRFPRRPGPLPDREVHPSELLPTEWPYRGHSVGSDPYNLSVETDPSASDNAYLPAASTAENVEDHPLAFTVDEPLESIAYRCERATADPSGRSEWKQGFLTGKAVGIRLALDRPDTRSDIELRAAVQRVRDLHRLSEYGTFCAFCEEVMPCPTILALDGDENPTETGIDLPGRA